MSSTDKHDGVQNFDGVNEYDESQFNSVYERENVGQIYWDINKQSEVLSRLNRFLYDRPWNEYTLARYGNYVAGLSTASVGFCMWSMGYNTMGLRKFGKGGYSALAATLIPVPMMAALMHSYFVTRHIFSPYRSENSSVHGFQSLWVHQISIAHSAVVTWGVCFYNAFRLELTPTRDDLFKLDSWRYNIKYFYKLMKPISKPLIHTYLISSLLMFVIGFKEHRQTVRALNEIGYDSVTGRPKQPHLARIKYV